MHVPAGTDGPGAAGGVDICYNALKNVPDRYRRYSKGGAVNTKLARRSMIAVFLWNCGGESHAKSIFETG